MNNPTEKIYPPAAADPRKGHGAAPSKPSKRGFEGFEGRDECHLCKIRVLSMWPSQPDQVEQAQTPRERSRAQNLGGDSIRSSSVC